MKLTHI